MKNQRILKQNDAAILSRLAEQLLRLADVELNVGEELLDIVSTSKILAADTERKDCVALYSSVSYTPANVDDKRILTLVCPHEANPELAYVSVLSPIGMALIGRKTLHIIDVALPANRMEKIKILEVANVNLISEVE
ncbi:GreA/GreB family elongation factor [Herminiimonas fonticola]|uniref:Regulator of nucleoside diphosphate kinase n=1 Tax=Herminiimonas fonticola TaxID=303380 RepID=A0A4R6G6V8_9BURK|nr:GreA/GreB family elongation factor [Herminiimonas fonticola]RBA24298.1 Transcription elongation factor [Herminiimonas fonticola]TDN90299.1 regulator of nucleoside diphosphate kinase [Herminiimonas fonticola]